MVLFGESLADLIQPEWAQYYIKYNDLKAVISAAKNAESHAGKAAQSDKFLTMLLLQTAGVGEFVKLEQGKMNKRLVALQAKASAVEIPALPRADTETADSLSAALKALTKSSVDYKAATATYLTELVSLGHACVALRRYVGTNVIAATKIVKKHDKMVPAELSKRQAVADEIMSMPFVTGTVLVGVCDKTDALIDAAMAKLCGSHRRVRAESEAADEETESLRELPQWLLSGAKDDATGANGGVLVRMHSQEHSSRLISTFLTDWKFKPPSDARRMSASGRKDNNWDVDFEDTNVKWSDLSFGGKFEAISINVIKVLLVFVCLYFFICSLSFLGDGFLLIAGKNAGKVFANSQVFNNPVAGLMVGVFVTVLVQSSSTSTSITITMVGAGLLTVAQAIPIIMGANIGTSVTSTLVALGQSGDRNEFRRAFAAATVHDMFNFLSVCVLLPLEVMFGLLNNIATGIVGSYTTLVSQEKPPDILKVITNPLTKAIIQLDKKVLSKIAVASAEELEKLEDVSMFKEPSEKVSYLLSGFYGNWTDLQAGIVVLIGAVFILCVCLLLMVNLLKSLLKGRVAVWLHKAVNDDVPDLRLTAVRKGQENGSGVVVPMGWLSGYLAMAAGMGLTIMVQSSSITTSALTPLVGVGVIKLERMYPTVLGANLGTTITGILAALAADGSKLQYTLAVAYAHLFFNILGTLIFYTIWPMRAVPIAAARGLGNITATYRWFPVVYIIFAFFLIPGVFVVLSLTSTAATLTVFILGVLTALFVGMVNYYQDNNPACLPSSLRNWNFLPECMRSLAPYDRMFCGRCVKAAPEVAPVNAEPVAPKACDIEIATRRLSAQV